MKHRRFQPPHDMSKILAFEFRCYCRKIPNFRPNKSKQKRKKLLKFVIKVVLKLNWKPIEMAKIKLHKLEKQMNMSKYN